MQDIYIMYVQNVCQCICKINIKYVQQMFISRSLNCVLLCVCILYYYVCIIIAKPCLLSIKINLYVENDFFMSHDVRSHRSHSEGQTVMRKTNSSSQG